MSLIDTLRATPPSLYAVADGARTEDLPGRLSRARLFARPLYKGEMQDVGIHLVSLREREEVASLLDLIGAEAPAVFWSWPGTEDGLFGHLRRLGRIEVPRNGTNPADPEYETVLFRHADPAALMAVLAILNDEQREGFFGEAKGVVFQKRDLRGHPGVVRVRRDGRILNGTVGAEAVPVQ